MREEGDRIEVEAPGLSGAVRARWLHPSGFSAAWRPLREREETVRELRGAAASSSNLRVKSQRVTGSWSLAAPQDSLPVLIVA